MVERTKTAESKQQHCSMLLFMPLLPNMAKTVLLPKESQM